MSRISRLLMAVFGLSLLGAILVWKFEKNSRQSDAFEGPALIDSVDIHKLVDQSLPGRKRSGMKISKQSDPGITQLINRYDSASGQVEEMLSIFELASGLARNPNYAKEWLGTLDDHPSNRAIFREFAKRYAIANAEEAKAYFRFIPPGIRSTAYLNGVCEGLMISSASEDAVEFARQHRPSSAAEFEVLLSNMVKAGTRTSDATSLFAIAESIEESAELRETTFEEIVTQNILAGNAAITQWVEDRADSENGPRYFTKLVGAWLASDSVSASAWLGKQMPSPAKDAGVTTLIETISTEYPEDAMTWVGQISEAEERLRAAREILARGIRTKEQKIDLIAGSSLSDEEKVALIQIL